MKAFVSAGVLLLLISALCFAQSASQASGVQDGMKLQLMIVNPDICVNAKSLPFEVVVTNEASEAFVIYKSSVSEFAFTSETRDRNKRTVQVFEDDKDLSAGGQAAPESPITVQPHSSIVVQLKYDVSGAFFLGGDIYSLQVGYRDVRSNIARNAFNGHEKSNVALFRRIPCE
jgi:hypothetical protein